MTTSNKTNKNEIKEILNSKNLMNDENLLNLDLDSLDSNNLDSLINNVSKNIKQKTVSQKDRLYKIEVNKQKRQQIRKKRDAHINNVLFLYSQKNNVELKKEIDLFDKFYKETYTLNDYSDNSIMQNNSDNETKIKVKIFLKIVKDSKTKVVKKPTTNKKESVIQKENKETETK